MCGRYASFASARDLADAFDVIHITEAAAELPPGYNIAPTDPVRVVVEPEGARALHTARWGLVPHWAKDIGIGARMINARSESVADKPAFAPSLAARRCLVLADGYYEWHTAPDPAGGTKPVKTPFYIHRTDRAPIAFAGLYAWWADPAKDRNAPDRWVLSTTIITQAARDGLEQIHDREPAVLEDAAIDDWLDAQAGTDTALAVLGRPTPPLSWYEVGKAVGSVRNQGAHLIEPV